MLNDSQYEEIFRLLDKDKDGNLDFPEFSLLAKGNLKEIKEYIPEVQRDISSIKLKPILKSKLPKNMSVVGDLIVGKEPNYNKYLLYSERKDEIKLSPIDKNDCRKHYAPQSTTKSKLNEKFRSFSRNRTRQSFNKHRSHVKLIQN